MLLFLFEQLRTASHSFGPTGEGADYSELDREVVVAVLLEVLVCMSGLPVHSNGQTTINLWFYSGIQEGDGTILLVVLHCRFYGRVNTIDVSKGSHFCQPPCG